MANDNAVQALADIQLHAGFAGVLAKDIESARNFLGDLKRITLGVLHTDIGGSKLGADPARMSASFDVLASLEDAELIEALRDYSATFTDSAQTILALRKQLGAELGPLRAAKASLETELADYKKRKQDVAETAKRQALLFANNLIVEVVAAHTRSVIPVDDAQQAIAHGMNVSDCSRFDMIAEIVPMIELDNGNESSLVQVEGGQELVGSMESYLLRTDSAGVVSCYLLEPLEWLVREHKVDPTQAKLSWADLSRRLEEYLESPHFFANLENEPEFRGVLLGFVNVLELNAATAVSPARDLDERNWAETLNNKPITPEELRRDLLPYLSNNCLVRQQSVDGTPLWCRVHTVHDPVSVETSSHAVLLDVGTEGELTVAYVAIGAIRPRNNLPKVDLPTATTRGGGE